MAKSSYDRKDDVVISTVYLYTPDSVIDLLSGNFVKEIFVYENLLDTFYSGSITLVDTKAIFEALDMSENCFIAMTFRTPLPSDTPDGSGGVVDPDKTSNPVTYLFRIDKTTSRTSPPKQAGEFIHLHMTSLSGFLDDISLRSKSYKGNAVTLIQQIASQSFYDKNDPANTSLETVNLPLPDFNSIATKNLGTQEVFDYTTSPYTFFEMKTGSQSEEFTKYSFPFCKASEKINEFCDELRDTKGNTGFCFWETRTGFKLASRQSLFEQKPVITLVKSFVNNRLFDESIGPLLNIYNMDDFEIGGANNRRRQMAQGGLQSSMYVYDITKKNWYRRNFSYETDNVYSSSVIPGRFPVVSASSSDPRFIDVVDGVSKIIMKDSASSRFNTTFFGDTPDEDTYGHEENAQSALSQRVMESDIYIEVNMSGNHFIEAGDTVQCVFPSIDRNKNMSEELSTTYLVRNVSHTFDFITKSHRMKLGLIRNFKTKPNATVLLSPEN
tara:strand:- start:409 stop:1899 length:1491 start_codon:yes stop_codon:yes gene_type:complete